MLVGVDDLFEVVDGFVVVYFEDLVFVLLDFVEEEVDFVEGREGERGGFRVLGGGGEGGFEGVGVAEGVDDFLDFYLVHLFGTEPAVYLIPLHPSPHILVPIRPLVLLRHLPQLEHNQPHKLHHSVQTHLEVFGILEQC